MTTTTAHPEAPHLAKCAELQAALRLLKEELIDNPPLLNQAKLHEENLAACQEYLTDTKHTVAFIGAVGVGKTTAICHLLGLYDADGKPLLSTSSGRTTLCEVELRRGDAPRIHIDPIDPREVESYLLDFVDVLDQRRGGEVNRDTEQSVLSSEFERCLRNMLGLTVKRLKMDNGTIARRDLALERLDELGSVEAFLDDALERLRLDQRTLCELEPPSGADPAKWLRESFEAINHGRHPDAPMPDRITIVLDQILLGEEAVEIRVVDTKGLDLNLEREDIDRQLHDPRTISVVCSGFNDAPEQSCQGLFEHMAEIGLEGQLSDETILMVLDRENEAANVMAEDGPVADAEEGRLVREEQVQDTLRGKLRLSTSALPSTVFLNATRDTPESIVAFLGDQIAALRQRRVEQIEGIAAAIDELVTNREEAQARAAFETVSNAIRAWVATSRNTIAKISNLYKPLVDDITTKEVYASSIRAAVNRKGEWQRFDFYYKLAIAARKMAVASFHVAVSEINSVLANQEKQDSLAPAHPFIRQLLHSVKARIDRINERASELTRQTFEPGWKADSEFWRSQQGEWGRGRGYKIRIADETEHWFHKHNPAPQEQQIQQDIMKSWTALIDEVEALLARRQ